MVLDTSLLLPPMEIHLLRFQSPRWVLLLLEISVVARPLTVPPRFHWGYLTLSECRFLKQCKEYAFTSGNNMNGVLYTRPDAVLYNRPSSAAENRT